MKVVLSFFLVNRVSRKQEKERTLFILPLPCAAFKAMTHPKLSQEKETNIDKIILMP